MRVRFRDCILHAIGGVAALLIPVSAAAQAADAMSRWRDATLDKLVPFLPDVSRSGFTAESSRLPYDFKAAANETTVNGVGYKYHALLVHKNWFFDDAELSAQLEEVRKQKEALKREMNASLEEFQKAHGAEMEALQRERVAQMDALSKQAAELFQKGKYEEGRAVLDKVKPFHYAPFETLVASFDKKQQELTDRENSLLARRRSVTFLIYTNRTALTTAISKKSNAPVYAVHPNGALAGHPFYRQAETTGLDPQLDKPSIKLAVYVGPVDFQNSRVKLTESIPKVKCIVVWAWIYPRLDTAQADEARVRKVLAAIDYEGLAKLIQP